VLHLIDGLGGGGCERWLWDIVRLTPESFEHRIVTIHPDSGDYVYADRLRALGAYDQRSGPRLLNILLRKIQDLTASARLVPLRKVLTLMWRLACYCLAAPELLKALIKFRPDVLHAHTYNGFVAGLIVKAVSGKPLVHTVPASLRSMKDARHGWMPAFYARSHRWVNRFFTGVSYDELLGMGIPASKLIFFRCGVDLEATNAIRDERARHYAQIRGSLGIPADARIALSVGRLHPSKGHLFALDALSLLIPQFANLHWVVLGEGFQRAELEARAAELGVAEHVHLVGFQPEPLPFYASANIYLRTPVFEAENLSSYQAIAMGLPVVGFDTGCETELIPEVGNGILVPNRDGAAFARAMARILSSPDGGRTTGELGAEYGRKHFDIRQVVSMFFSVYSDLGEERRAGASRL
jgi:glycosyltransferase involved in cell wall biosynthesis